MDMENTAYLGFLSLTETKDKNGYIGAILVTDLLSTPLEFRCTQPVKPTTIQKSLYGELLHPFIGNELCGKHLIEALQLKPSCLFVNSEFFLKLRPEIAIPCLFVRSSGQGEEIESSSEENKSSSRFMIESPAGDFEPIVAKTNYSFKEDFEEIKTILGERSNNFHMLEPFSRISKALEALAQQDSKFQ